MKIRGKLKKIGIIISTTLLSVATIIAGQSQVHAELREGRVTIGRFYASTMSFTKNLDLSSVEGLNIRVTPQEQEAFVNQAKDEFKEDILYAVGDVIEAKDKLEEEGITLMMDDGSYNPDWDTAWKQAYPYTKSERRSEFDKGLSVIGNSFTLPSWVRDKLQDAPSVYSTTNRFQLLYMISSSNVISLAEYDDAAEEINLAADTNIGTTSWWKIFKPLIEMDEENPRVKQYIDTYVSLRTNELMTRRLNEQLEGKLDGLKFDFYAQELDDKDIKDAKYGIGNYKTLTIEAGKFNEEQEAEGYHLSTVDFGAYKQKYDKTIIDTLTAYKTMPIYKTTSNMNEEPSIPSVNNDLFAGIGGYRLFTTGGHDLVTYLLLTNQAAITNVSEPYVQFGGDATTGFVIEEKDKNGYINRYVPFWPGVSATRGEEDPVWRSEPLADFSILAPIINGHGSVKHSDTWSFLDEIPLTGEIMLSYFGDNYMYPTFDENGKLVSIAKPLLNALGNPQGGWFEEIAEAAHTFKKENTFGNFDYDALIKATDVEAPSENGATTVKRFKLVEKKSDAKLGTSKIKENTEVKILDVTPYGFMIFDSLAKANEYYDAVLPLSENKITSFTFESDAGIGYMIKYGANFSNTFEVVPPPETPKVRFLKQSEDGTPLAGADMEIMKGTEEEPVPLDEKGTYRWTTSEKEKEFKISPGDYVLVEHKAPEGYDVIKNTAFTVTKDYKVTFKEEKENVSYDKDKTVVKITDVKTPPTPTPTPDSPTPETGIQNHVWLFAIVAITGFAVCVALAIYKRKNS